MDPVNDENMSFLTQETLQIYLGKFKEDLKAKFPDLDVWSTEDTWYAVLRANFAKNCERNHLRSIANFGNRGIRPLYKINDPAMVKQGNDTNLNSLLETIDLRYVCSQLICKATAANRNMEKRALLALTLHAVGRGGEVKFQQYLDWVWHPLFRVPDIKWIELKTYDNYAMPVIADADGFEADVFHCMGSYWVCDRGLFGEPGPEAVRDFVFPSLHRFKDGYVAKLLTQHI
jgi:hypothetical protein